MLAMEHDILQALDVVKDPERFLVVSSPQPYLAPLLREHLIPVTASLQHGLGGSRTSLHAKVAGKILKEQGEFPLRSDKLRARYLKLAAKTPKVSLPTRDSLTDAQVASFVRQNRHKQARPSWSSLLRMLRTGGQACEQKRFKAIFIRELGGQGDA